MSTTRRDPARAIDKHDPPQVYTGPISYEQITDPPSLGAFMMGDSGSEDVAIIPGPQGPQGVQGIPGVGGGGGTSYIVLPNDDYLFNDDVLITLGGPGASGFGTPGVLAKWGTSGSLTSSILTEAPGKITLSGDTLVLTTDISQIWKPNDNGRLVVSGGSALSTANGALVQLFGNNAGATNRGTIFLQAGSPGTPTGDDGTFIFQTANVNRWQVDRAGHFIAYADNTYDIGATAVTRPRNIYVGTQLLLEGAAPALRFTNSVVNAAVAVTLGSTGPTGSTAGAPRGWVPVSIAGTTRYIPFW